MAFVRKYIDLIFLGVVSLAGIALVFVATSRYGAGLPTDGMRYISVAQNWLEGNGLFYYDRSPLVWFPPLYPVLIAVLSFLSRVDVFVVAWVLNAALWGVNLYLSGLFLRKVFGEGSIYFYLGMLLVFLSPSSLYMHTNVLTEPLFLTFTLLFFLVACKYIETRAVSALIWLALLAIAASMQRWAGFSHIVTGGLVILYAYRRDWRQFFRGVLIAGGYVVLTFIPVAAWIYFHNYRPYGTYWGSSSEGNVFVTENLLQALRKVFYWYVPYRPISPDGKIEPVVVLGIVLLILLVINRKNHWLAWARDYLNPGYTVSALFFAVNFSSTTLMIQTNDHRSLFSDRYYALLLLPMLLVMFQVIDRLVIPHLRMTQKKIYLGLVILIALLSVVPVTRLAAYLGASLENGEASHYNNYNTRAFHESPTLKEAVSIWQREPSATFYSNIPAPIWFFARKNLDGLPFKNRAWTKDEFKEKMAGWPGDRPGYIVWFEPDPFKIVYSPEELYLITDMELIYEAADGLIVYVRPLEK